MASAVPPGKVSDPSPHALDEVNVVTQPANAQAWLDMLKDSEKAFEDWNLRCDNIDKLFANLDMLADQNRDKQFQMFWANLQVLAPSIYAKPPVPVVVPRFKDRRPVFQAASEMAERCAVVAFDTTRVNDAMLLVRDDLVLHGRGVVWCRYERERNYRPERVCIEHKDRRDFLHSISRNWYEVEWVAAASYLTREEAKARFRPFSGDAWEDADYKVNRDATEVGGADFRERAKFWEVWHRGLHKVVWVAEGVDVLLDEVEPHLELTDYFPAPCPAYGTVQPGSLVPVPDVLYYMDQLSEINLLTGKIHALSDALEAKGFYPAGGGEIAEAIETAVKMRSSARLLVPISNWAQFGQTKEVIVWLPMDMIANTISALVTLRKQIIDDIYQIMGLSDIMRGSTDPNETLGAQQLKMQNGSVRIRDRQNELARLSKDLVCITTEVITEKFADRTMLEMSQMQLPTKAQIRQQMMAIEQQVEFQKQKFMQLSQTPQAQQIAQTNPGMTQQVMQQGQQLLDQSQKEMMRLAAKPTIEDVMSFLRNNRARAFVLDIETDSTIQPDETAEKQRRAEFMGMMSNLLPQLSSMVMAVPQTAEFAGEILKFAVAPFRVSRQLDGAIDGLVDQMQTLAEQGGGGMQGGKGDQAHEMQLEQMKQQFQSQENDKDRQLKQAEIMVRRQSDAEKNQAEKDVAMLEYQGNERERQAKIIQINAQMQRDQQKHMADMQKQRNDMVLNTQKQQIQRVGQAEKVAFQRENMRQKTVDNALNRQQKASQFNQQRQDRQMNPGGPGA